LSYGGRGCVAVLSDGSSSPAHTGNHEAAAANKGRTLIRSVPFPYARVVAPTDSRLPHLGSTALVMLRPTQISAWRRRLADDLAPRYVRVIFANLSLVLSAAVDDERIARNPCQAASVRLPRAADPRLVPWHTDLVQAVAAALPSRCRVLVAVGAGCGLRQGEIFGLAVEDVDFLRGVVHVRRQVKIVGGRQVYAPPKDARSGTCRCPARSPRPWRRTCRSGRPSRSSCRGSRRPARCVVSGCR